jgi:hypothetical protein
MRTGKRHSFCLTAFAFAALAGAVPAHAGGPDDRALSRSTSSTSAAISPDDRAGYRGVSDTLAPRSLSPDDRVAYRGVSATASPKSVSPDDRAFARSVPGGEPRTIPTTVALPAGSFDWTDALIGATLGLGLALLGAGAFLVAVRHRRSALETA